MKNRTAVLLLNAAFLSLFLLMNGCIKKNVDDSEALGEDREYTDTFNAKDWDRPMSRKKIESGDKHIGKYIAAEMMDPFIRSTGLIIEEMLDAFTKPDYEKLKTLMTPSCYNSFFLRYPSFKIVKDYELRVELPIQTDAKEYWVKFKVMLDGKHVLGKILIDHSSSDPLISDYEQEFFSSVIGSFLDPDK